jgi:hypothetical protein
MNPDDFRRLYGPYFALNCRLWERGIAPLSAEQFRRPTAYSVGSVRHQVVPSPRPTPSTRWASYSR